GVLPIIGAALVLILAVAGTLFVRNRGHKHPTTSSVIGIDDGLPHTLEQLNAWYVEPPAGQNAATFYSRGFDVMETRNAANLPLLGKAKLPPLGTPLSSSMHSSLGTFLEPNRETVQLFAQAAAN